MDSKNPGKSNLSPIEWLNNRATNRERFNFPDFVSALGYWREQDAHEAYISLLSMSALPQQVRAAANSEYKLWRRNCGKAYWASRAISSRLSMSAKKRTAVGVIHKSERIIDQEQLDDSDHESEAADKASLHKGKVRSFDFNDVLLFKCIYEPN